MAKNLFAVCRSNGDLIAKHVRLEESVQREVEAQFDEQETEFRDGVTIEIPFDGSWKPDSEELLTIDVPQDAKIFEATISANAMSFQDVDTKAFLDEGIKALFTGVSNNGSTKVLVQRFTQQQRLERGKFSLLMSGNTFRRLSEPAFSLDTSLTCIIEEGKIKFKSQQKLRSIINLLDIYRAATDQEVEAFAGHANLEVADVAVFVATTNQTSRKLIHIVANNRILDAHSPQDIQRAAQDTGLTIKVENDKIVMPTDHAEIKALLQFLDESRYAGPLSGKPFITNSRRPA